MTRKELLVEMPESKKDGLAIALGGVVVNFRREFKPFERFEVWTRILTWDHKWLFLVGHFVQPGSVEVEGYTLKPWKRGRRERNAGGKEGGGKEDNGKRPVIFASGIAKYVFKKGRLTIPLRGCYAFRSFFHLSQRIMIPRLSARHRIPRGRRWKGRRLL